jgi:hypothetical protein
LDGVTTPNPHHDLPTDNPIITRCGPFVDFWCIVVVHKWVDIGIIFLARYLQKIQPRMVEARSAKLFQMFNNGKIVLPSYCDNPDFLNADVDTLEFLTDAGWKPGWEEVLPGQDETDDSDDEVVVQVGGGRLRLREGAPDRDPGRGGRGPQPGFEDPDNPEDPDGPDGPDVPDDPEEWEEQAPEEFIRCHAGKIYVWTYGLGCFAVGVSVLDSGFYNYQPVLQPYLFRLMVLTASLVALTRAVVADQSMRPGDVGPWTKARCEDVALLAEEKAVDLGLRARIEEAREELTTVMGAIFRLRKLGHKSDDARKKQRLKASVAASKNRLQGPSIITHLFAPGCD